MTIATPLSPRLERVRHIDRSAIEPLGLGNPNQKNKCSLGRSAREHFGAI
jgi:hypothetical protein